MFSAPATTRFKTLATLAILVMVTDPAWCAGPTPMAETTPSTGKQRQELIEIMKGVNFVPQLGADNPMCKGFYDDFKKQTNIEYIQPIVKAESYDDPVLRPYQKQCPKLDFRLTYWVDGHQDTTGWTDEEVRTLGIPTWGLRHFRLYKVNIDNDTKNGEELVFYYEGERAVKEQLPYGRPPVKQEILSPERRAYHVIDYQNCRISLGVSFNDGGSARWTRNELIRYRNTNSVFVLKSGPGEQPDYRLLELWMYSEKMKRMVPACTYLAPR